jgi:hypothetical protein
MPQQRPHCPKCKSEDVIAAGVAHSCSGCGVALVKTKVRGGIFGDSFAYQEANRPTLEKHGTAGPLTDVVIEVEEG